MVGLQGVGRRLEKKKIKGKQEERYGTTDSQVSHSSIFLDRAPDREGLFGQGGYPFRLERGEPSTQSPIMVLPSGAEIVEFMPNEKDLVVLEGEENYQKEVEEEGEGDRAEDRGQMSWKESCLLRFSQFFGMSSKGYEDEMLDLMKR